MSCFYDARGEPSPSARYPRRPGAILTITYRDGEASWVERDIDEQPEPQSNKLHALLRGIWRSASAGAVSSQTTSARH